MRVVLYSTDEKLIILALSKELSTYEREREREKKREREREYKRVYNILHCQ